MNYNEKLEENNTLASFIDNYLSVKEVSEKDEQLKAFLQMIEYDDYKDDLIDLKLRLIPKDLLEEVQFYIENQYKGNVEKYLKTIEIYFNTFTFENLVKCNILDSETFEYSTTAGRRKLKRERKHNIWHASVLLKLVGKKRAKYSCNTIFNEFKKAKRKEFDFIENCKIVSTDKTVIALKDCVRTSKQSVAEKLNLIKVQEQIATDNEWTWCFITLTLEGEYHPNPKIGKNSYNGVSPRDSAKMMGENIKRVRSLLAKRDIKAGKDYVGCGSSESFADGCLHKHLMFFCSSKNIANIKKAFIEHFPNIEKLEKSFIVESEENKLKPWKQKEDEYIKGKFREKASSYIFKYVMKSIVSYDSSINFDNMNKENKNAVLNNAFRSYNFIRGFSFFGIDNCLTKFRFIARNLKSMDLPAEISSLVEENNLYELLTCGYLDMFDNVYAKEEREIKGKMTVISRTFVGCKFQGNIYMKKFFSLIRNAVNLSIEAIDINSKLAYLRELNLSKLVGVILMHNDTRDEQSSSNGFLNYTILEKLIRNRTLESINL